MNYNIIPIERFRREAKRLIKKYPTLKDELIELNSLLTKTPDLGTSLGNNTYKVRLAIKSKGKGKSGGARVITYLLTEEKEIYLLTIFDKSEFDSIDDKSLKNIIQSLVQSQKNKNV
ncbi:MAG: type II toxin-antitoxin system RelE/ParE family toxin [Bacteroidia bacterium]|nr:type II toxin-antitoxin system RelE/ParE family toxin [Bacteroidia bacterium]MCF8426476.1 type II toxin-antitoxin system RelE/ParE family toxin [Bacteroidia bacterium]